MAEDNSRRFAPQRFKTAVDDRSKVDPTGCVTSTMLSSGENTNSGWTQVSNNNRNYQHQRSNLSSGYHKQGGRRDYGDVGSNEHGNEENPFDRNRRGFQQRSTRGPNSRKNIDHIPKSNYDAEYDNVVPYYSKKQILSLYKEFQAPVDFVYIDGVTVSQDGNQLTPVHLMPESENEKKIRDNRANGFVVSKSRTYVRGGPVRQEGKQRGAGKLDDNRFKDVFSSSIKKEVIESSVEVEVAEKAPYWNNLGSKSEESVKPLSSSSTSSKWVSSRIQKKMEIVKLEDDEGNTFSTMKPTDNDSRFGNFNIPHDRRDWFYIDPSGHLQGPFTTNKMASWYSMGSYFHQDLRCNFVERGARFDAELIPLKVWFSSGRLAFLSSADQIHSINDQQDNEPFVSASEDGQSDFRNGTFLWQSSNNTENGNENMQMESFRSSIPGNSNMGYINPQQQHNMMQSHDWQMQPQNQTHQPHTASNTNSGLQQHNQNNGFDFGFGSHMSQMNSQMGQHPNNVGLGMFSNQYHNQQNMDSFQYHMSQNMQQQPHQQGMQQLGLQQGIPSQMMQQHIQQNMDQRNRQAFIQESQRLSQSHPHQRGMIDNHFQQQSHNQSQQQYGQFPPQDRRMQPQSNNANQQQQHMMSHFYDQQMQSGFYQQTPHQNLQQFSYSEVEIPQPTGGNWMDSPLLQTLPTPQGVDFTSLDTHSEKSLVRSKEEVSMIEPSIEQSAVDTSELDDNMHLNEADANESKWIKKKTPRRGKRGKKNKRDDEERDDTMTKESDEEEVVEKNEMEKDLQIPVSNIPLKVSGPLLASTTNWGKTDKKKKPDSALSVSEIQRQQEEEFHAIEEIRLKELQIQKAQAAKPVWGVQQPVRSLREIQQEEIEKAKLEIEYSAPLRVPGANGPVWGRSHNAKVLSLREIQSLDESEAKANSPTNSYLRQMQAAPQNAPQSWTNTPVNANTVFADPTPPVNSSSTAKGWTQVAVKPVSPTEEQLQPQNSGMFWDEDDNESVKKPVKSTKKNKTDDSVQNIFGGTALPRKFEEWCVTELKKISKDANATFAHYITHLDSPHQVREYIREYLGDNAECRTFADKFLTNKVYYCSSNRDKRNVRSPKEGWSTVGQSASQPEEKKKKRTRRKNKK